MTGAQAHTGACWCGGALDPTRYHGRAFRLLRCASCGCYRIDPPPITRDEESADFYTAYYDDKRPAGEAASPLDRRRSSRFWRVVEQVPGLSDPAGSVIDFGSGDGRLCDELLASGWTDVVGIEVSRVRAARARARYPEIRFYDRPLRETNLRPHTADLCVMDNVIEHLPDPAKAVADLRAYLKPSGKLVVITPNMESGHFRLLGRRWTPELAPHAHIFLFTIEALGRLLREAGFTVCASGTFHDDPYPLRRWAARLRSGDAKGAAWRAHQELGALYGRLIGAGPMLFAVAEAGPVVAPENDVIARRPTPGPAPTAGLLPGISIVLCTYRRPSSVARFLDSVAGQTRRPDELLVVDASPDAETERVVAAGGAGCRVEYWRVSGPLRGLTRQRNFGLRHVSRELVAFFDDDVVLEPRCLEELERAHRSSEEIVGVGCFAETFTPPTLLWKVRRALGMVPHLRPGSYTPGGISIPWRFLAPTDRLVDGDWLPGCAMMVKTRAACRVLFDETLVGYAQGEDLDFSLRLRRFGRLAMAGAARCRHLHEPAGRPDALRLGQMEIWNRHRIWRRVYCTPSPLVRWRFAYAWSLDTVLLARDIIRRGRAREAIFRIAGRLLGASRILSSRAA
ncbi:MAG TPA: methyltransferase domain-containing protein [Vicinamibacterales bacterium]|nr:methyltransferase domain-containing protein [Vicinamibacterales bacterium]